MKQTPLMRWNDWVHAIIGTHGSWLPGDPRGFRDHDHRIHSSGDYRHQPPPREHAALLESSLELCPTAITIPSELRKEVAESLADKLISIQHPPRTVSVSGQHAHLLVRVGDLDAKPIIGRAKQLASFRIRHELPGTIWSQGCHVVRVRDEDHYRNIVYYIEHHAHDGAFVWNHPDLRRASGPASI